MPIEVKPIHLVAHPCTHPIRKSNGRRANAVRAKALTRPPGFAKLNFQAVFPRNTKLSSPPAGPVPITSRSQGLSLRESLHSLTRGLSNQEIAKQFGIGRESVKEHIDSLYAKIGAANRTEAVAIAFRKHLLKF